MDDPNFSKKDIFGDATPIIVIMYVYHKKYALSRMEAYISEILTRTEKEGSYVCV
jgi:hypothetical protein